MREERQIGATDDRREMRRNPWNKAIPATKTGATLVLTHVGWRWLGGNADEPR
jgi:hypothetical protein